MVTAEDKAIVRAHYRQVLTIIADRLGSNGLKKSGECFWKVLPDHSAFAGLVFRSRTWQGSKRLAFYIGIQGAHSKFHELNPTRKTEKFAAKEGNFQFGTDICEPKGAGSISKEWILFPSSDPQLIAENVLERIVQEALPILEVLLDETKMIAAVCAGKIWPTTPIFRENIRAYINC